MRKILSYSLLLASIAMPISACAASAPKNNARTPEQIAQSSRIVFRHDTTPEYKVQYRIPAIVTVGKGKAKGRLVAMSDYRYCGGDIGAGRIDMYISTSDDNGKTWTEAGHMLDKEGNPVAKGTGAPGNTIDNLDCGFGDAALVADRDSQRVLLIACCGRMNIGRSTRENPQPSARWWSEDGGKTWSKPDYTLWQEIYGLFDKDRPIDGQFIASGRIMQSRYIKKDKYYRIYAASMVQNDHFKNTRNYVLYSDDFGKTWNILGDAFNAPIPTGGDEAKVEELPDGSVIISGRGYSGNRNFNIFKYTDAKAGKGSWGNVVNAQLGFSEKVPACNGELFILPVKNVKTGKKTYLALHSIPFGPKRTNVGIAWKVLNSPADYNSPEAFAENWTGRYQVSNRGSAYSTITQLKDGRLGFFYEEDTLGRDYCSVFVPLSIEEITNGQYKAIK